MLAATGTAEPASNEPKIEEVFVSATRSGETLAETPISVTITADLELRNTNITDLETLSDRLPNAQLAYTPTNTFLFVRGLGTGAVRSAEQSVGFFIDGIFLGRPQVALFDFLDVQQVEVLRGPQGAILGKNTVAGAVNVATANTTAELEGYLEVLRGSDGQQRVRGALSGPLSDTVEARVAWSRLDDDGYLENTTQNRTDLSRPGESARIKLRFDPSDWQSYGISIQAADIEQRGDSFELSSASDEVLSLYRQFDPQTDDDITDNRTHTDNANSGAKIDGRDLILTGEWQTDIGMFRFLGSSSRQDTISDFDVDIGPVPFLTFPAVENYKQRSAELRFDRTFSWGAISSGLYYFKSNLDLNVDINAFEAGAQSTLLALDNQQLAPVLGTLGTALASLPASVRLGQGTSRHNLDQQQDTRSVFGSAKWDISQQFTLRGDLRFTREVKEGDLFLQFMGTTGPLVGAALGEEEYELQTRRTERDFSPRLSLLWNADDLLSAYATVARGFKSGGFNNLAAVAERAEFDEEKSQTYEAGLRLQTDAGLSGELGLFYTEFDNLQVAALDGTEFFVGNAARAVTQGIELSARWEIGFGFSVSGALGYLDAEYREYVGAPARADSGEESQDLSGETLQRAPEYSGSVQIDFNTVLPWVALPFAAGVVAEGATEQFLNVDLDPIDSQENYIRYNAYLGLSDPDLRYSLKIIGRNLTDEIVRREAGDIAIVGAHFVGVYPPRSIAAELGVRF